MLNENVSFNEDGVCFLIIFVLIFLELCEQKSLHGEFDYNTVQ